MSEFLGAAERASLLETLRARSRNDYLQALLLPSDARDTFIALRNFHVELIDIVGKAKEVPLAEIRLQWWADGILGPRAHELASHPVGQAVLKYLDGRPHARKTLAAKAEAHSEELYSDAPADRTAVEELAGATRSVLVQLVASELGEPAEWTEASGHTGVAELVADRVAVLPDLVRKGAVPIPCDLLQAENIPPEQWLAGGNEADAATHAFARSGLEHVALARRALPKMRSSKPFAQLGLLDTVLREAAANPTAARERGVRVGPLRSQWLLWRG